MARPSITPEKKAAMRSRIRTAVLRIAQRRKIEPSDIAGWRNITIRDVVEEADISTGTFYKYFENREELGQLLWSEPVDRLRSKMQSDSDATADPKEKIRVLLENYAHFAIDNGGLFKSVFLSVRPHKTPTRDMFELEDEVFYTHLCSAFRNGQETGAFRQFEPHKMAQIFWAAVHGSLALPINLDRYDFDSPEALSKDMIDTLLSLITPEQ